MKDWEKNYDDRIGRPYDPELVHLNNIISALKIEIGQLKRKIEELEQEKREQF